jgi:hypothetical protein
MSLVTLGPSGLVGNLVRAMACPRPLAWGLAQAGEDKPSPLRGSGSLALRYVI